jgi:hypothetical protein
MFLCSIFRAFFEGSCGRHIISGGNDAHIILWDWPQNLPEGSTWRDILLVSNAADSTGRSVMKVNNRMKINCIASLESTIFVADTSDILKVYTVL